MGRNGRVMIQKYIGVAKSEEVLLVRNLCHGINPKEGYLSEAYDVLRDGFMPMAKDAFKGRLSMAIPVDMIMPVAVLMHGGDGKLAPMIMGNNFDKDTYGDNLGWN